MRLSKFAIVYGAILAVMPGISAFAAATPSATDPPARNPAHRAERQAELKAIRTDIQVVRAAHKSHDKSAVQAGLAQFETDWQALPPKLQKRIQEKHPAIVKKSRAHLSEPATP